MSMLSGPTDKMFEEGFRMSSCQWSVVTTFPNPKRGWSVGSSFGSCLYELVSLTFRSTFRSHECTTRDADVDNCTSIQYNVGMGDGDSARPGSARHCGSDKRPSGGARLSAFPLFTTHVLTYQGQPWSRGCWQLKLSVPLM